MSRTKTWRGRATALLIALMAVVMSAGTAWANGPAQRFILDVTGDQFVCDGALYTVTSGQIQVVVHEGSAAQGNENFTVTISSRKAMASDGESEVSIVGTVWFGGAFNANTGGEVFTETDKLQFVSSGDGTVGSVNFTLHVTAQPNNFVLKDFNFGTCDFG